MRNALFSPSSLDVEHVKDHFQILYLAPGQFSPHLLGQPVHVLHLALVETLGQGQNVVALLLVLQPVLFVDRSLKGFGLLAQLLLVLQVMNRF